MRSVARRFGIGSALALAVLLATGAAMALRADRWGDSVLQVDTPRRRARARRSSRSLALIWLGSSAHGDGGLRHALNATTRASPGGCGRGGRATRAARGAPADLAPAPARAGPWPAGPAREDDVGHLVRAVAPHDPWRGLAGLRPRRVDEPEPVIVEQSGVPGGRRRAHGDLPAGPAPDLGRGRGDEHGVPVAGLQQLVEPEGGVGAPSGRSDRPTTPASACARAAPDGSTENSGRASASSCASTPARSIGRQAAPTASSASASGGHAVRPMAARASSAIAVLRSSPRRDVISTSPVRVP